MYTICVWHIDVDVDVAKSGLKATPFLLDEPQRETGTGKITTP